MQPRKLHLGAFDQAAVGWLNTDVTPHMLLARAPALPRLAHRLGLIGDERYDAYSSGAFAALRYLDVARRFRFDADTFDCAYTSHMLEHLYPDVAEHCLREVHRVLRPGGIVRIAVPDLDQLVASYDPADPGPFLYGIYQARDRHTRNAHRHWWHYNSRSLAALLTRLGFRDARQCTFRAGRCPDLDRIETRQWTLFMEAIK